MNLYLVDGKSYVIANGLAGASYLANLGNPTLICKNIEGGFNPRLIGAREAKKIILRMKQDENLVGE